MDPGLKLVISWEIYIVLKLWKKYNQLLHRVGRPGQKAETGIWYQKAIVHVLFLLCTWNSMIWIYNFQCRQAERQVGTQAGRLTDMLQIISISIVIVYLYLKLYLLWIIWNLQEFVTVDKGAGTMFHRISATGYCRYVQIHPVSWVEQIALRVELYGREAGN